MKTIAFVQSSAAADCAILYVALELSKSKWMAGLHWPGSGKLSEHAVDGGDFAGLLELIDKKRKEAEAALLRPVRVVSCYEAGYDGFWLHWTLCDNGVENRVLDPASIPVNRRKRRAKSDRLDLKALLRALMALERGEDKACQVVRAPTVAEEDERRRSRERGQLVEERTSHTNRIGGYLMLHGIREFAPRKKNWRKQLDALLRPDGQPLPPVAKEEIARECLRLHLIMEQISQVEAEQLAAVKASASEEAPPGHIEVLCKLRGIGLNSASPLEHELFYRDFKNRRQVGGYSGLAGSPWQSGTVDREQGISKAGNPKVRQLAIELAWLWLRYQPASALTRWFEAKVAGAKGRLRRIAIVAMARKLLVALWRYVTTGVVPEGAVFKAA